MAVADRTSTHPILRSTMIVAPRLTTLAASAALAAIVLILVASGKSALAFTPLVNGNFETGDLKGWTVDNTYGGNASAVTSYDHPYQVSCIESWGGPCYDIETVPPKEGSYFALVKSPDQQTKATGISQPFEASAGDKVSGWAFFASQQNLVNPDTGDNDDKGQVVIKSDSGTTVATPFAESVSRVGYGASSGWKYWEYAFTEAGKFQIEARVQNTGPSYCPGCTVMGLDDVKTSIAGPDTTPPETYITSGPGSYTTSTSVSFGFSSNEKGSTFECRLTRAGAQNLALSEVLEDWTDCTSPRSYSNLDYTYYTFQVRATDPAGNVDPTPAAQSWTSDTSGATRQSFNITSPDNNSYDTDGSFSVSGSAPAGSTVELFEGTTSKGTAKADSSTGAWSIALSGVSEGAHTYKAKATDTAGYISFASNSVTVTVDKKAPAGTVSINNGASSTSSRSVTLTLSATDPSPGSGVTEMRISNTQSGVSSASWAAYSTSKAWTLTAGKGTKTVYVQYRDAADNRSAIVTDTITYRP